MKTRVGGLLLLVAAGLYGCSASPDANSLADLAAYPLITYVRGVAGRVRLDSLFERQGLSPKIVLDALDAVLGRGIKP